jgi:hypothetical protein
VGSSAHYVCERELDSGVSEECGEGSTINGIAHCGRLPKKESGQSGAAKEFHASKVMTTTVLTSKRHKKRGPTQVELTRHSASSSPLWTVLIGIFRPASTVRPRPRVRRLRFEDRRPHRVEASWLSLLRRGGSRGDRRCLPHASAAEGFKRVCWGTERVRRRTGPQRVGLERERRGKGPDRAGSARRGWGRRRREPAFMQMVPVM